MTAPLARLRTVVLDCPEPRALAEFYSALLGRPITYDDGDFAVVSADDRTSGLAFQRSPDQRPPTWPDPAVPQQIHLDVTTIPHILIPGLPDAPPSTARYVPLSGPTFIAARPDHGVHATLTFLDDGRFLYGGGRAAPREG